MLSRLLCLLGLVVPEDGSDCESDIIDATVDVISDDREDGIGELRVGRGECRGEERRLVTLLVRLPPREECFCRTAIIASRSAS